MSGSSQGSFARLCEQEAKIAKSREVSGGPLNQKSSQFSAFVSKHRLLWLLVIGILFVGLDQGTKKWAQENLATEVESLEPIVFEGAIEARPVKHFLPSKEIVVIPEAFSLIYRENPAAAFSLTRSLPEWFRRPFLLIISTLASIFFLIWYFRIREQDVPLLTAFCLIMAGAIGNLIDRATLGYVIDFLDVYAGFLGYPFAHWPTFNIADSCIVVGALTVLLRSFQNRVS